HNLVEEFLCQQSDLSIELQFRRLGQWGNSTAGNRRLARDYPRTQFADGHLRLQLECGQSGAFWLQPAARDFGSSGAVQRFSTGNQQPVGESISRSPDINGDGPVYARFFSVRRSVLEL